LDKLDLGILKALLVNNGIPPGTPVLRRSFRSMAKDMGVDQGTIRNRIKGFHEQRVLKGWYLGVSPGLTGQGVIYAWLNVEPESSKDDVIEGLSSVEDVERICNYFGPRLGLVLFYRSETDPDVALRRLAPIIGLDKPLHRQAAIRVPTYELKETDTAIIDVLRKDPWRPYPAVAKEIGVSAKTVKRRATRLAEDGAIHMLPIVDLKALQGIIPMELVVDYSSRESRAAVNGLIMSRVKDNLVFSDNSGPFGYFALVVPNISQVEQITRWVKQQKSVREVHSDALQDVVLNRRHYEPWRRLVKLESEEDEEGVRVLDLDMRTKPRQSV
jgi:DNA-binding Lrp family transcriptional regulator